MPSFLLRTALPLLAAATCLLPAPAAAQASSCQFMQVAQVPLQFAGAGLGLTMTGEINGKPATMLPDTGAGVTYLTRTGIERHGLAMRATGGYVQGVAGKSRLYDAKVAEFAVGPVRARDVYLGVVGETTFTPAFDAIAGAAFLLQTDLEFSLATKELRFFRPEGCGSTWLAYWDRNASVIPFRGHDELTPNPHFFVHVNGQRLSAMIDSGASVTTITRHAARRAGIDLDGPRATRVANAHGVGRQSVASWIVTADTFKVGDATVHHPEFDVLDAQLSVDVLLGADFLRAHRVLFAMSQGKLYVSYLGGAPFDSRREVRPWMRQEADAGNADAWLAMARIADSDRSTRRDPAAAIGYLERAAALGKREASLTLGARSLVQGNPAQALTHLRATLGQGHTGRNGALWLYLAQLRAGEPQAGAELATRFEGHEAWPRPVVDYFLGKSDAARALAAADTPGRACFAANLIGLHEETLGKPAGTILPKDCASLREQYAGVGPALGSGADMAL
ncbi:aspartyl protease family protein [Massilia aurea]|uniref:aspartyl protease family protein n=1 Tax=Massilia aurea TaxID=373040 RepID=UPI0034620BF2